MSTNDYSLSERGGGAGDTGQMRAAILNQVGVYFDQASWEDPDRAERLYEKLVEAPEKYISPNPTTNYQEEASRVYQEIKSEHGLRTKRDTKKARRDWKERAERHAERCRAENDTLTPAGAGTDESGRSAFAGAGDTDVSKAPEPDEVIPDGRLEDTDPTPNRVDITPSPTASQSVSTEPTPTRSLARRVGEAVGRTVRSWVPRLLRWAWVFVCWVVPLLARAAVRTVAVSSRVLGWSLKQYVRLGRLLVSIIFVLGTGVVIGLTGGRGVGAA